MKPVRLLIAALVATLAFVGLAVGSASATTAEDCQAQLATLRADTVAAQTSFTNKVSVTSEVAKLDDASAKLTEAKNADAVQKLVDYQTTLNSLATATKAKVAASSAQTLTAEAQGVIDCINAIGTTDATSTTA
jgi:predicted Rossmann fold nucleotide-binding protein DprA/Smf involved in DNA uptake